LADFVERQKIVPLKRNPPPDAVIQTKVTRFVIRFKVFFQDALWQPRQLLPRVQASLDHLGELARAFHIGRIDPEVVEGEVPHPLREHDGKRVRLLPHC